MIETTETAARPRRYSDPAPADWELTDLIARGGEIGRLAKALRNERQRSEQIDRVIRAAAAAREMWRPEDSRPRQHHPECPCFACCFDEVAREVDALELPEGALL